MSTRDARIVRGQKCLGFRFEGVVRVNRLQMERDPKERSHHIANRKGHITLQAYRIRGWLRNDRTDAPTLWGPHTYETIILSLQTIYNAPYVGLRSTYRAPTG